MVTTKDTTHIIITDCLNHHTNIKQNKTFTRTYLTRHDNTENCLSDVGIHSLLSG